MTHSNHGIVRDERGEEQPRDKQRAQTVHKWQSLKYDTNLGDYVTGITANNKTYDGTTTASLNVAAAELLGVVSGDLVTLNTVGAVGAFADASAGTAKLVTISGVTLSGTHAANYTLTQPTATADITAGTPVVTWPTPAPIVYGTALDGTQLNASSIVPETFAYTPASGSPSSSTSLR